MIMWAHNLLVKIGVKPRARIILSLPNVKKGDVNIRGKLTIYGDHADIVILIRHLLNNPTTKPLVTEAMHDSIAEDLDTMGGLFDKDDHYKHTRDSIERSLGKIKDSIKTEKDPEA